MVRDRNSFRTELQGAASQREDEEIVRQIDPQATLDRVATLEQLVSNSMVRTRLYSVLLGIFAAVGLALALAGIYGVVSYAVAHRTPEIGVRIALGATGADVIGLVVRQALFFILTGIGIGLAGAAAVTRMLESLLFGITPHDATRFFVVPVVFAVVAMSAAWVPARRGTRIDPLAALRCE